MALIENVRLFLSNRKLKKLRLEIKSKIVQNGSVIEIRRGTTVTFVEGSCRGDIVVGENVMLNGCHLLSSNHGKIVLGNNTKLGKNTKLTAVEGIVIGDYSAVAQNVTIIDNNTHPVNPEYRQYMRLTSHNDDARSMIHADHKQIVIGKNCWIGENSRIQKGVTVGDNAVVAACSVVTKDVPSNSIAAGNPAKIVKTDIDRIPAPKSCEEFNKYIESKK